MTKYALIGWHPDGTPYSRHFGDVYYTKGDGLAESRHVFLAATGLAKKCHVKPMVKIGELGFGTGLNFLAAMEMFCRTAPIHHTLHYHSIERYPLRPSDLAKALRQWPELAPEAALLIASYDPAVCTHYVLSHAGRQVILHLYIGDAVTMVQDLPIVDAWFLDGFAPAKNKDMWGKEMLADIYNRTVGGGSLATFTAAGAVKRGLEAAGFTVQKTTGYGRKREMLCAIKK